MAPHMLFWPFDLGKVPLEHERARAPSHFLDPLRVGVLAGDAGHELRLEGHLMACEICREASICLWERVREKVVPASGGQRYSCLRTRNALFRHLGEGRPLEETAASHLRECPGCAEHFLEPARAMHTLEVDEGAVAAQD